MDRLKLKKEDFSKFAGFVGMGFYRVTRDGQFIECDSRARELFGIPEDADLSTKSIADLYAVPAERELRLNQLQEKQNEPLSDTLSVRINDRNVLLFDICWLDEHESISGLIRDVRESNLLRSLRTIERMPTGFYYIEHAGNDKDHEHERITQCNDRFAQILGFEKKEDAIGVNMVKLFHVFPEQRENYFKWLYETDKMGKPLLNLLFKTRRIDNKEIIYLSIDAHIVRNERGDVIGREGTIRDISEEIDLKNRVEESRRGLEKTTADINKFMHTFLHPVVKFAGNSELLAQVGDLLQKTGQIEKSSIPEGKELGEQLLHKLLEIRNKISDIDKKIVSKGPLYNKDGRDLLKISTLKEKLTSIIYIFDYSLKTERSVLLLDNTIRDTAIWVLDEVNKINFLQYSELDFLVKEGYIEFLHKLLFHHMIHIAEIMKLETEIMKNGIEALRGYIGLQKERKYSLVKTDLKKILEENVDRFKPTFLAKGIEMEYRFSGDLSAEVAPNDIDRVICNLLHNAGKYSHPGTGRFVKVKAREIQPSDQVEFSIESFGIPIKNKEIESGLIFEFGFRGELASKSYRDGTGVGLADAKDTIESHGGELILSSKPARDDGYPPAYKVPYITAVTVKIPKKAKKNEE